ncbi:MAG: hypothetical protein ABS99_10400 [Acetobacteraceae bacterium SCN 69-10]|nr:MAG: hypothetical protein ABS99_10400 [Acetobacteraceae bacterium SCN 69-10]
MALDASLRRLGVEHIDLYQMHAWDGLTPLEEKGQEIFDMILRVASGEKTKSELLGYGDNEFVPWHIGATV